MSAERNGGQVVSLRVYSEKGLPLRIVSPQTGEVVELQTKAGEEMELMDF